MQAEIELRGMWFVVAVAEERNFSRAANRCNIAQPALSRRVKEVEEALGTKLFERQTRSVSVTAAGKVFVREARRALEQSRRAPREDYYEKTSGTSDTRTARLNTAH